MTTLDQLARIAIVLSLAAIIGLLAGACERLNPATYLGVAYILTGVAHRDRPLCAADELMINNICQKRDESNAYIWRPTPRQPGHALPR
jgi:hypothetical protein